MSGSSLDGLDIVYTHLTEIRGKWTYEIHAATCIPYTDEWQNKLANAAQLSVPEFLKLHTAYGRLCAEMIASFIEQHDLIHSIDFVASHGHTVWHEPAAFTTSQIGDGATMASILRLPVITDLRNTDVALGGQGAPIVPIADRYLLKEYDFCLNIGGIANITYNQKEPIAFDICPANQILNHFAQKLGKEYDEGGNIARAGNANTAILSALNELEFYHRSTPKSLHNGFVHEAVLPLFKDEIVENNLSTATIHIASQIANALQPFQNQETPQRLLATGGGALNSFLIEKLQEQLQPLNIEVVVPNTDWVFYKEAVAMALIGALRWREERNVFSSVTGASRDSVGGALWLY